MNNREFKALLGAWDQALGTFISAVSSTPSFKLKATVRTRLSLLGNVMQATGNALLADSERKPSLGKLGNQIQSIGNLTVIVGLSIQSGGKKGTRLNIAGNLLQALGSGIAIPEQWPIHRHASKQELLNLYGSLLQMIGNALQAIAGMIALKRLNGQTINFLGSWIQAVGALLQALAQSKGNEKQRRHAG